MALKVDLTGNSTGFGRMLETARMQAKEFSSAVSRDINTSFTGAFKGSLVGMLSFQGLQGIVQGILRQINDLRNTMDQVGTGDVEGVQKWGQAFERVGGTVSDVTRIISSMQEAREKAMGHDLGAITARQQLEGMGFSGADIDPAKGLDPLAFMGRAFKFANANAANSAYFESVFGPRSSRFAAAGKYESAEQAPISKEMFATMAEVEGKLHEFGETVERVAWKIGAVITSSVGNDVLQKSMMDAETASNRERAEINRIRSKGNKATPFETQWMKMAIRSQQPTSAAPDRRNGWLANFMEHWFGIKINEFTPENTTRPARMPSAPSIGSKWWTDWQREHQQARAPGTSQAGPPVDQDVQNQLDAWKTEEQAALEGLNRIRETHMTIGDRLKLINQDLAASHQNTMLIQGKLKSPTLGVSATAFGQMTDIQKDQLRHQLTMDLLGAQSKEADLKNQKYQAPLSFQADSLARAGLYSASAVRFNPVLGLQQETNNLLKQVVHNTARPTLLPPNDPHRP